jgi:hypothetical protein
MQGFICVTCGTQSAPADSAPEHCPTCEDERQFVPHTGQQWTTLDALRREHFNAWRRYEPGLWGIGTFPSFAIGQRALLVCTPQGNVLWDCISLLDDATVDLVRGLGGITAIAISHPHFYASMVEWAHAFNAPVWLHSADRAHVMRPDPAIRFWSGTTHALVDRLTLINTPGHFDGSAILHWAAGADGRGVLLSGDTFQVVPDGRHVSFMRSYPNYIPLPARTVRSLVAVTEPYVYDRIYGIWWHSVIQSNAKSSVARSAARYVAWLADPAPTGGEASGT